MSTLTEFLHNEAVRLRKEGPSRQAQLKAWKTAAAKLMLQIREWIKEVDPENVLTVHSDPLTRAEEGFGFYDIDGLRIKLDDQEVWVTPVSLQVLPPLSLEVAGKNVSGVVQITDRETKYRVYRILKGSEESWLLHYGKEDFRPFDKAAFEEVLLELLK